MNLRDVAESDFDCPGIHEPMPLPIISTPQATRSPGWAIVATYVVIIVGMAALWCSTMRAQSPAAKPPVTAAYTKLKSDDVLLLMTAEAARAESNEIMLTAQVQAADQQKKLQEQAQQAQARLNATVEDVKRRNKCAEIRRESDGAFTCVPEPIKKATEGSVK